MYIDYRIATIPQLSYFTLSEKNIFKLNNNDTLGERIRKLRKVKHLSTKQLGDYLNISSAGIISYENNNAHPSPLVILKLYKLFGYDLICNEYIKFITSNYWDKLKTWRLSNNLTKKSVAHILGVSEGTYIGWENQKTYITNYTFKRLKNKLKNIMDLTT